MLAGREGEGQRLQRHRIGPVRQRDRRHAHAGEAGLQLRLRPIVGELLRHLHRDHSERLLSRRDVDPPLEGNAMRGFLRRDEEVARDAVGKSAAVEAGQPLRGERAVIHRGEETRHLRAADRKLHHQHGGAPGGIGESGEIAAGDHARRRRQLDCRTCKTRPVGRRIGDARKGQQREKKHGAADHGLQQKTHCRTLYAKCDEMSLG